MKAAIVALALFAGCGSEASLVGAADAGDEASDAGVVTVAPEPGGGTDAGSPPPSDAGLPAPTSHWVRDFALPGMPPVFFHSSAPGDLWLEGTPEVLYHRVNGEWVLAYQGGPGTEQAWIRSQHEAWILQDPSSKNAWKWTLHIVSDGGSRDLLLPDITPGFYGTIGDGWISYFRRGPTLPPNCSSNTNDPGVVGLLRVTDSGFVDVPLPDLCESSLPDYIYMGTGISPTGDILSWNGSTWELTASFHGLGYHGIFTPPETVFGVLSGSVPNDLYAWSWAANGFGYHFDGTAWTPDGLSQVWVQPWGGPRWALGGNGWYEAFEFQDDVWQDRGPLPARGNPTNGGSPAFGSDGADIFVGGYEWNSSLVPMSVWIYRYSP